MMIQHMCRGKYPMMIAHVSREVPYDDSTCVEGSTL